MRDYPAEIPWAKISHRLDHQRGHRYEAKEGTNVVGTLRYIKDFPKPGVITIHDLIVDPDYQKRGVGIALLHRLHKDNPTYMIDPSHPSEEGYEFIQSIWETEPLVEKVILLRPHVKEQLEVNRDSPETR